MPPLALLDQAILLCIPKSKLILFCVRSQEVTGYRFW